MTRGHRKLHLMAWMVLGPIVVLVLVVALAMRHGMGV